MLEDFSVCYSFRTRLQFLPRPTLRYLPSALRFAYSALGCLCEPSQGEPIMEVSQFAGMRLCVRVFPDKRCCRFLVLGLFRLRRTESKSKFGSTSFNAT